MSFCGDIPAAVAAAQCWWLYCWRWDLPYHSKVLCHPGHLQGHQVCWGRQVAEDLPCYACCAFGTVLGLMDRCRCCWRLTAGLWQNVSDERSLSAIQACNWNIHISDSVRLLVIVNKCCSHKRRYGNDDGVCCRVKRMLVHGRVRWSLNQWE